MCGPAGSGNPTLARRFERDGYVRLSFDEVAWQRGYRAHPVPDAVAAEIHAYLRDGLVALIGRGHHVVVDTSFWSRAARESYRSLVALARLGAARHGPPRRHSLRRPRAQVP